MKVLDSLNAIRREDHDEFLPSVCATLVKADAVLPGFRESAPF